MARRRGEDRVIARLAGELAAGKTHRDDDHSRRLGGGLHGRVQIPVDSAVGFKENDVGHGGHDVGPLDVQRFFHRPAANRSRGGKGREPPCWLSFWKVGPLPRVELRQTVISRELVQVAEGIGIIVGIDDGDRLAAAVARVGNALAVVEDHVSHSVGPADLAGRHAHGAGRPDGRGRALEFERGMQLGIGRQAGSNRQQRANFQPLEAQGAVARGGAERSRATPARSSRSQRWVGSLRHNCPFGCSGPSMANLRPHHQKRVRMSFKPKAGALPIFLQNNLAWTDPVQSSLELVREPVRHDSSQGHRVGSQLLLYLVWRKMQ